MQQKQHSTGLFSNNIHQQSTAATAFSSNLQQQQPAAAAAVGSSNWQQMISPNRPFQSIYISCL